MLSFPATISRWWSRRRPRQGRRARPPRYLPHLEIMEDRTVLSPGVLDTTFGMGGKATVSFLPGANSGRAQGVVVQPDGKLVLAGFAQRSTMNSDFAIARLNANGSLDSGFNAGGKNTVSFNLGGFTNAGARAVALQPDGKIVVAGFAQRTANDFDFAVARLLANGFLDTSFNSTGTTNFGFGLGNVNDDEATSLAIQPDGKIVVVGFAQRTANDFDFAIARLNSDGSLDASFNGSGKTNFGFNLGASANKDEAFGVALQADGKIVVVGFAQVAGFNFDFAVARLNANGGLDPTFHGTGKVSVAYDLGGNDNDEAFGVALQGDGRIVVAGFAERGPGDFNFAVARLNTDGSLDTAFAGGGKATVAFALGGGTLDDDEATALAIQPDGRIVVTGFAQRGVTDYDFAIARLTANGSLDPSWNGTGKAVIPFNLGGGNNDRSYAVAVQPDGRVVAVGSAEGNMNFNFAVARVEGAPTRFFAIAGFPGRVRVFRPDGSLVTDFAPYGPAYRGGVSVGFGDVNGDGVMDLVTGATAGNPHVKVFNGAALANGTFDPNNPDKSLLGQFFPYALQFNVGANVAAGDVDGSGYADIVTGATVGNPHVKVYSGKDIATGTFNPANPEASVRAQFFAYGLQFNVGANVAVGPVTGSGYADVVTGATVGNPQVKVYSGRAIGTGGFNPANPDASILAQFFAYGLQFDIGAFVTVGDANGDGFGDIITGASLGTPHVKVYSGRAIANGTFNGASPDSSILNQFFAFDLGQNIGVAVAALENFEGSGTTAILTGARNAPNYRVVAASATDLKPPALNGLDTFASDIQDALDVGG